MHNWSERKARDYRLHELTSFAGQCLDQGCRKDFMLPVYAVSRRGTEQPGRYLLLVLSFLSLFPKKIAEGHEHSSRGKPLAPDPLVTALQHVIAFCEYLEMKYEWSIKYIYAIITHGVSS